MTAIEINHLRKVYKDVVAVDNLDLCIQEGELFALLGVNGAGKTTTVKMLATLLAPTDGDAVVMGHSIVQEPAKVRECVDISMQETAIARKLTVAENLDFYMRLSGQGKEEREATKEFVCKAFGLEQVQNKRADKLSGGWQRKLSIALALASKPKMLFLDEPTLGLDVLARRELWNAILSLKGQITIILTTHYMEEAEALADRIGIMKEGKLLFAGDKDALYAATQTNNVEDAFVALVTGVSL